MPNVTLSLDEDTYRTARIIAAQNNQSVSAMVRAYLQSLNTASRTPEERVTALFAALDAGQGPFAISDRFSREEANERPR
jgi:plasmid stability protein